MGPWNRLFRREAGPAATLGETPSAEAGSLAFIFLFDELPALEEIRRIVTIFRELRSGQTEDGQTRLKSPSGALSTAEAISVVNNGLALAGHFGDGRLSAADVAAGIIGAVIRDPVQDRTVWLEYLETVVKSRQGWGDLYRACREMTG